MSKSNRPTKRHYSSFSVLSSIAIKGIRTALKLNAFYGPSGTESFSTITHMHLEAAPPSPHHPTHHLAPLNRCVVSAGLSVGPATPPFFGNRLPAPLQRFGTKAKTLSNRVCNWFCGRDTQTIKHMKPVLKLQ